MSLNLRLAPEGEMVSTWVRINTIPLDSHIYRQYYPEGEDGMTHLLDYYNNWCDESATIHPVPRMTIWIPFASQTVGVVVLPRKSGQPYVSIQDVVETVYETVHGKFAGPLTARRQWAGLTESPVGSQNMEYDLNLV